MVRIPIGRANTVGYECLIMCARNYPVLKAIAKRLSSWSITLFVTVSTHFYDLSKFLELVNYPNDTFGSHFREATV